MMKETHKQRRKALSAEAGMQKKEVELAQMRVARSYIEAYATQLFPAIGLTKIMEILDLYGVESYEQERERVQYHILELSEGDMEKLFHYLKAAKQDYRDVIYWTEYPHLSKLPEVEK